MTHEQSFMPGLEPEVKPVPKAPVPVRHIPNYEERKRKVVAEWNQYADIESTNWARCSKIPAGKVGKLLDARVRDPWWCFFGPFGMQILASLDFYKGTDRKFRLESFLRPDALRAILDGEWGHSGLHEDKKCKDDPDQLPELQKKWGERGK